MECIDHWLANHTTCPLCRLSLIPSAKVHSESPNNQVEIAPESFTVAEADATSGQSGDGFCGELESTLLSEPCNEDIRTSNTADAEEGRSECATEGIEVTVERREPEEHERISCLNPNINSDMEQATA